MTPTPRQRAVLEFVDRHIVEHRLPPTLREISDQFGWSSTMAPRDHLVALQRKGLITITPHISRGIRITDEGHAALKGVSAMPKTNGHTSTDAICAQLEQQIAAIKQNIVEQQHALKQLIGALEVLSNAKPRKVVARRNGSGGESLSEQISVAAGTWKTMKQLRADTGLADHEGFAQLVGQLVFTGQLKARGNPGSKEYRVA